MFVILLGITISVKPLEPKAHSPILVTELGIEINAKR